MKDDAKIHVQSKRPKKQKGHKPPIQSQKTATPNLANLAQTGLQHLSRADIMALQQTIGNRAVARLMTQRQDDEELMMRPRNQRQEDEEQEQVVPGARMKPLRENGAQQRDGSELSSSPTQRASSASSATGEIGDATDLDGQGLYGWDRVTYASDMATVVNGVIPTMSTAEDTEPLRIVIFSGTHGTDPGGHLLNDAASRGFVAEDQATANAVNASNPGVQVEVVDVVNTYKTKAELTAIYGMKNYIRILGWCFSKRSYNLGDKLKSNWWSAPDAL